MLSHQFDSYKQTEITKNRKLEIVTILSNIYKIGDNVIVTIPAEANTRNKKP